MCGLHGDGTAAKDSDAVDLNWYFCDSFAPSQWKSREESDRYEYWVWVMLMMIRPRMWQMRLVWTRNVTGFIVFHFNVCSYAPSCGMASYSTTWAPHKWSTVIDGHFRWWDRVRTPIQPLPNGISSCNACNILRASISKLFDIVDTNDGGSARSDEWRHTYSYVDVQNLMAMSSILNRLFIQFSFVTRITKGEPFPSPPSTDQHNWMR